MKSLLYLSATFRTRLLLAALAAALALLAFAAYRTSFAGAFTFDDGLCLMGDRAVDAWFPAKPRVPTTGRVRWLTHLTFVANYKLHGLTPFGFHVGNLAIHIVAGWLLFGLVRRTLLLPATAQKYEKSATGLSFAVAAIWLVHPLQTESVTYIVQRLESLAGLFFLLTLYTLVRGATSKRGWLWYSLTVVAVLVGCGAKETMFLAPLAALAYDRIFLSNSWRQLARRRWYVYAGMLPAIGWSAYALSYSLSPSAKSLMGFGLRNVTAWEYLRSQPAVILHYLRLCFWPVNQCIDYGWPIEQDPWRIYGLGAVILGLLAATLLALRLRPRLGFVGLAFFLILAPTSSFIPIRDLAFEHRMYLPLASVVILAVLGWYELWQRVFQLPVPRRVMLCASLAIVVVTLGLRTSQRNRIYHDPIDTWTEAVTRSPHHQRAWYNLGQCLSNRGFTIQGGGDYRRLLLTDPRSIQQYGKQSTPVKLTGDLAAALPYYEQALALDPKDASAHFNMGGIFDRAGQAAEAIEQYELALSCSRRHLHARLNLARLLTEKGDLAVAEKHYRLAMSYSADDARPRSSLGKLLAQQGRHREAVPLFREARRLNSAHVSSQVGLAKSLWELGEEQAAIGELRAVRKRLANLVDVNLALARFLATTRVRELQSPAEGAVLAQKVVDAQQGGDSEGWEVLALCLSELGRWDEAAGKLDKAIELTTTAGKAEKVAELREWRARLESYVNERDAGVH